MTKNRVTRVVKLIIIAIIALPVFGFLVMSLWNWLMPAVFGLKAIGFLQALGLFFLSRILFGGFGGDGGRRHRHDALMRHWERMSPEERERFRAGIEGRGPVPQS